jgi:hypothetical protein
LLDTNQKKLSFLSTHFKELNVGGIMPRLVGKQSNNGLLTGLVLVVVIAAAAGGAEYLGYTNLIPGWGKDQRAVSQSMTPVTAAFSSASTVQH